MTEEYYQGFSCMECSAENQAREDQTAVPNDISDPCFWASLRRQNKEIVRSILEARRHSRQKKAGYEFVNQLNILPQPLADGTSRSSVSMLAVMALPHLVLGKAKNSHDGSIVKRISRRSQWKRADIEKLFNDTKALQAMCSKNSNKTDDSETKQFNRMMGVAKISSAIGLLAESYSRFFPSATQ